jgi:hypothetical protein
LPEADHANAESTRHGDVWNGESRSKMGRKKLRKSEEMCAAPPWSTSLIVFNISFMICFFQVAQLFGTFPFLNEWGDIFGILKIGHTFTS